MVEPDLARPKLYSSHLRLCVPASAACDCHLWSSTRTVCHTFQCSFIVLPLLPLYTEVSGAPFNVSITNNLQRSQVLSWVAPFDGNRPITQYVIYVSSSRQPSLTQIHPPLGGGRTRRQTTGDSTDPVPSVTLTGNPTTVIVSDLIPFVEYSYTVEAVNELGRSDMSQPSPFVQTEAAGKSTSRKSLFLLYLFIFILFTLCSLCGICIVSVHL